MYPTHADGFNQVPQSNKFWSSLMFQRSPVATGDKTTPQDSNGNQLYPLYADPLTGMVNSDVTVDAKGTSTADAFVITVPADKALQLTLGMTVKGADLRDNTVINAINVSNGQLTLSKTVKKSFTDEPLEFNDFAGLGLAYLSSSAMFVLPSKPFNDPVGANLVPTGQPQVWANPQAPGAESWQYAYGTIAPTEYQDFSIGLQGVQRRRQGAELLRLDRHNRLAGDGLEWKRTEARRDHG